MSTKYIPPPRITDCFGARKTSLAHRFRFDSHVASAVNIENKKLYQQISRQTRVHVEVFHFSALNCVMPELP